MNYYNPFLAAFPSLVTTQFNPLLEADYTAAHAKVADVETAFSTTDFTPQPPGGVPLTVTRVCTWTSMCSSRGTIIHPTPTRYGVIAAAFQAVLKYGEPAGGARYLCAPPAPV